MIIIIIVIIIIIIIVIISARRRFLHLCVLVGAANPTGAAGDEDRAAMIS